MAEPYKPRLLPLLGIASLVTLVVTVVCVIGELQGWAAGWFQAVSRSPWNPFGIAALVPLFGFLFGRRLALCGSRPQFVAAFFVPMFAVVLLAGVGGYMRKELEGETLRSAIGYLAYGGPALVLLALFAWPRAFLVNLAYAVLARAPVVIVQYLDVQNGWQTQYGKAHPKLPPMTADERFWFLATMQGTVWVPFTILLGGGCAALGAATVRR
jgi:hypothetical protein